MLKHLHPNAITHLIALFNFILTQAIYPVEASLYPPLLETKHGLALASVY